MDNFEFGHMSRQTDNGTEGLKQTCLKRGTSWSATGICYIYEGMHVLLNKN
jgi:hypothetical protein